MDEFVQILTSIAHLDRRIQRVEEVMHDLLGTVQNLYMPGPATAESQRPHKPFEKRFLRDVLVPYDANAVPNFEGREIFKSERMPTRGFTHHNCFVNIDLARDTVPADTGDHLLFTLILEGSAGSGWVELDRRTINSTGRTGRVQCPVLAAESLAIDTRFRLMAGDNATYEQPPPANPRQIRLAIFGVLVSGPEL